MAGKNFVGKDYVSFTNSGLSKPVSRVTMIIDSETAVTAGDDSGHEMRSECPFATQEMADRLLARIKGYRFQKFSAEAARLDPTTELGDTVDINGVYAIISHRADDGSMFPDISAVGEAELEDEYPEEGPVTQAFNLKIAKTRTMITKTSSQIRLEVAELTSAMAAEFVIELTSITGRVNGLDGQFSEFKNTVDGFTITGPDGTTRIKGSSIETESIAAGAIKAEQVQLSGAITWADLSSDAQGKVNTAQSTANSAQSAANSAQSTASAAQRAASSAQTAAENVKSTVNGWRYQGTTYIDGANLKTDTVTASKLQGGTVSLLNNLGGESAQFILSDTQFGGIGLEIDTPSGGMRFLSRGNVYFGAWRGWLSGDQGKVTLLMADDYIAIKTLMFYPSDDNRTSLGKSSNKWSAVYSSTGQIQTSDANLKHDIEGLPDKYLDMFNHLTPKIYRLNDGASGRLHVGFIAQEVEEVMDLCGIDSTEFGGFVKDKDEEGKDIYMLRYEEFTPIEWGKLQQIEKRLSALEANYGR